MAGALRAAGRYDAANPTPLHDRDWWFRAQVRGAGAHQMRLEGLATIADVFIGGEHVLHSENMFQTHRVPVATRASETLHLCCRSLDAWLSTRRGRGRGRWRPAMIQPASLRHARTTLLGHMAGWCPAVHAVGPWRPVALLPEGEAEAVQSELCVTCDAGIGRVSIRLRFPSAAPALGRCVVGEVRGTLERTDATTLAGEVLVPEPHLWWPHTHGEPTLYPVVAEFDDHALDLGQVGFRHLELDRGADERGFTLRVNGVPVFCRGAAWMPLDLVSLCDQYEEIVQALLPLRAAGMNMLRVSGTTIYGGEAFYRACDELGIMVWQDFMFANLDYPADDPPFAGSCALEARDFLQRTLTSPSLAILCGGSEVSQQAAMLGLPRERWTSPLFTTTLADVSETWRPDVPYIPNTPCAPIGSGELPFRADEGVTHYYGVGAYQRPPSDARASGVRFAAECLAFAQVPCAQTVEETALAPIHQTAWKAAVPRDAGASWDFEDVRDHYVASLYGMDPQRLRREDPDRYLTLSRAVTVDVMEEVFAEWRRVGSLCAGGLVWTCRDFVAGAGWGVVDALGRAKPSLHALARAFRPRHVLLTDEGLNGLAVHVVNEAADEMRVVLSLACLRDGELPVASAERSLVVPPRGSICLSSSELLDRFFDATYAYRFGPPALNVSHAAIRDASDSRLISEAFHFPNGRLFQTASLDLRATLTQDADAWVLALTTRALAQHVCIRADGFVPDDNWFHLSPLQPRRIRLVSCGGSAPSGDVTATNLSRPVRFGALQ